MTRREVRGVLHRLADTAFSPLLAQFIDEAELSDAEIKDLKRRLDEKRKQAARRAPAKADVGRGKRRKEQS